MLDTKILVVGAGPTGLMLSAQLNRFGADHVIVDKKAGITKISKALAVQARTLEYYRQLGFAQEAIDQGFIATSIRIVVNGQVRGGAKFGVMGEGLSPYPFLFILEQSRNEALLQNHLTEYGGGIRWSTEVSGLEADGDGFRGLLRNGDREEAFRCQYLIGCGGAGSPVRRFLDMPFPGSTNEQLFFVADVNLDMKLDKQGLLLVINDDEFLAFFPMSGENQYRAIGILPESIVDPDDIPFDLIKEHLESNMGLPAKVTGHSWVSGYRVHHRVAESFRRGNAFLVGDAAHIHSPAGGQGMNTGLGDAANLGWKLAAVSNGWASETILDSYTEERLPFARQLVQTTDRAFATMVSKKAGPRFFRTQIVPRAIGLATSIGPLRQRAFKTVSQTQINYRKSALSDGSWSGSIASGDRFPWFEWEGGNSFDWLARAGYVVLRLGDAGSQPVAGWSGPVTEFRVVGAALEAAVRSGLPANGVVTVRPDMHIGGIFR